MRTVQRIALVLVIIGALNWGLIGLFQWDLVAALFGGQESAMSRVVYTLVGISALFSLPMLFDPMPESDGERKSDNLNYATEFGEENEPFRKKD